MAEGEVVDLYKSSMPDCTLRTMLREDYLRAIFVREQSKRAPRGAVGKGYMYGQLGDV